MAAPTITVPSWIQHSELIVGENSPLGLADVSNRPTKTTYNDLVSHHNANEGVHGIPVGTYIAKTSRSDQLVATTALVAPHTFSAGDVTITGNLILTGTFSNKLVTEAGILSRGSSLLRVEDSGVSGAPAGSIGWGVEIGAGAASSGGFIYTWNRTTSLYGETRITGTNVAVFTSSGSGVSALTFTVSPNGVTKLERNSSNYLTVSVGATGTVIFDVVGSAPGVTFNDPVTFAGGSSYSGTTAFTNAVTITVTNEVPLSLTQALSGANGQSALSIVPTWNTTGTPTAISVSVTDTASNANSNLLTMVVSASTKFAIHKSGATGIGSTYATNVGIRLESIILTGSTSQAGILSIAIFGSGATTYGAALNVGVVTTAASFTMATGYGLRIVDAVKGAGSTITTLIGVYVEGQTQGGTNWAIYTDGTTASRFGGAVTVASGNFTVTSGTIFQGATAVSLVGHTHAAVDITSGTLTAVRGGTGISSISDGSVLIGNSAAGGSWTQLTPTPASVQYLRWNGTVMAWVAFSQIGTDLAATFAALSHTHAAADIASGNLAYARLPSGAGTWTVSGLVTVTADILAVGESSSLARIRLKGFYGASPSDPPTSETDIIVVDTGAAQVLRVRYNDAGTMRVGDLALV